MSKSPPVTLYVNLVGAVCVLGLGGYFVRSVFQDHSTPPCSSTYPAPTQIVFENQNGEPLNPAELQARSGAEERGVFENARVVQVSGAPARSVLEVRVSGTPDKAGIRSDWQFSGLQSAHSACLAYSVWLPPDFQFGKLGLLPGMYVGRKFDPSDRPTQDTGVTTRVRWDSEGAGSLVAQAAAAPEGYLFRGNGVKLPTDRWVRIEQEVSLNDPGDANGTLRLWIDGKLVVEARRAVYRSEPAITLSGVAADIGYGDRRAVDKDMAIRLSPFELRWR